MQGAQEAGELEGGKIWGVERAAGGEGGGGGVAALDQSLARP